MAYYSQIGQDQYFIENVSEGKRGGLFFDIGANNGIFTSNTATLELEYGWTGLCVEANPSLIEDLTKSRLASKIEHCAVWSSSGEIQFEIPQNNFHDTNGDLLSRITGVDEIDTRNKAYFKDHFNAETTLVTVPAKTITELAAEHYGLPLTIDYVSIDTEGAELEALKGIDFDQIKIKFMTVEHGCRPGFIEELEAYIYQFGYRTHRVNKWDVEFELIEEFHRRTHYIPE